MQGLNSDIKKLIIYFFSLQKKLQLINVFIHAKRSEFLQELLNVSDFYFFFIRHKIELWTEI